jgi:O-antigen/teichoic acid export membrane protein
MRGRPEAAGALRETAGLALPALAPLGRRPAAILAYGRLAVSLRAPAASGRAAARALADGEGAGVRDQLKRLTAESVVYGLGQVGGRAVQLLLVPILTRALAPGAFGVSELVFAYAQTAVLVLVFGMDGALARFFYQEPDREARIRMISTSLLFRLAVSVSAALVVGLAAAPLAGQLIGGEVYRKYLLVGAISLPFTLLVMFSNDVLRVTFQPWKFIVLNLTQTALVGTLSLVLVLRYHLGVIGVLYGRLGGDAVSALLGLVLIRHALRPRFSRATLRRMLSYGIPSVPAAFGFAAIAGLDRYMMQRTRSLEELAVYAVAMKFFAVVTMGASAFQLAYGPFAYARAGSPESPKLFARVLGAYVGLGTIGAFAVGVFAPEALRVLVPASYHGAAAPAALLVFAAVALGAYTVTSIGIGLALKTGLLGLCAGGGALVAGVFQLLLTPRYGAVGAAAATGLGYVAVALITYAVSQRVHPLPYRGRRLAVLFVCAASTCVVVQRVAPGGTAGVAVKVAALLAIAGLTVALRVWTDSGAVARGAGQATDA